ncbi:MAG TPA: amidase family protein, partial [Solirubrobacterales bacterium]|nr:amidase family protein [Solirubrobacterales bacterium]
MADLQLLAASGSETAARIASGNVSAGEVLDFWLERAAGDPLNGYLWHADAEAARTGVSADGGALSGVPLAIKDIFCTEGVPTTAASKILGGYVPPHTATSVARTAAAMPS